MDTIWIVLISIFGFAFLFVLFYFFVNFLFYKMSLSRRNLTKLIVNSAVRRRKEEMMIDFDWFDDKKVEILEMKSKDKLLLKANFYEQDKSEYLAVICHGYGADFREMSSYAKYFYDRGFSLLLPEARGHGLSQGKIIGMGWPERKDIKKWIDLMVKKNPNYKIVLFGLSMGSSTVCMTVGENLASNVKCAISDCGYANAYEQFKYVSSLFKVFHPNLVMKMYNGFLREVFRINLHDFDAAKQLKKTNIPMLFIHGEKDEFVPYKNLDILYNACASNCKEKYSVAGAKHAMSYATNVEEYINRLNKFLDKYFYKI